MARNVARFRQERNLNRRFGVQQPVADWHTPEERQRLIQMILAEEKINKIELTPNHARLVEEVLNARQMSK